MPIPFFAPFYQHFAPLLKGYNFTISAEEHNSSGFGSGVLRLASERYFLHIVVDGMGPEVTLNIGRSGQPATDLAWIFAFLTHPRIPGAPEGTGALAGGLYFFPHLALNKWGDESVAWQAARLADALQPLWAGVLIFLDMDGPRSAEFLAFRKRVEREAAERAADSYLPAAPRFVDGNSQNLFAPHAQKSFAFLAAYGFHLARTAPLMVRYEAAGPAAESAAKTPAAITPAAAETAALYATVFQRPQSCALGVHTGRAASSPGGELNFDLEELAAWNGLRYTPEVVRRDEELPAALNRLSRIYRKLAAPLLGGDMRLFEALLTRRIDAARRVSRVWADRHRER